MKAIELTETGGPEVMHLREISTPQGQEIGAAMRTRALLDHTYNLRALEFQAAMQASNEITSETASLAHSHV